MPKKTNGGALWNFDGLDNVLKALQGQIPSAAVGVLGDKAQRATEGDNNATIGARHEFGVEGMPQRSFLRVPIMTHLDSALKQAGGFSKKYLKELVDNGTFTNFIEKVGIVGEGVVAEAFETGGDGKWKPSDMRYKKVQQTLVESQQLRNSITSKVVI